MSNKRKARLRSVPFTVLLDVEDSDAFDEFDAAAAAFNEVPSKPDEGPDKHAAARRAASERLAKAHAAVQGQEAHGRFQALPFLRWDEVKGEHPPREGHDDDLLFGIAVTGWPDVVRACVAESDLDDDDWESLSMGDYRRLVEQVVTLNESGVVTPKLPSSFTATSRRGAGSK